MFGKRKSLVGLDIGSSAIKAVELKPAGKGYRIAAFGSAPVPPEAIVDGAIVDPAAVAGAIKRVLDGNKAFRSQDVCASLSGSAVIVKKITLPVMTKTELAESIHWEAEQYIPFDIQDVNLDYRVLDDGTSGDARGKMEVLLVAAKKERIGDYANVITTAGRTPVVIDVDAFALQHAFEMSYGVDPTAVVVLLNAGASSITINILQGDQSVFTRDISMGGNAYTEALQKELDLPFDAAEQLKKGIPVDGATFEEAQPVLRAVTENILIEIQKTFDFFRATASSDRIDRIVLSGGASRVDGFREMLAERFEAPVEDLDPFKAIGWDARKMGGEPDAHAAAAVAVGLALRRAADLRINLLGSEKPVARRGFSFDAGRQVVFASGGLVLATVLGIGYWHWSLTQAAAQLEAEIASAQSEQSRVRSLLAELAQFEARRGVLQQRVQLIQQLRGGQSVPVQLLDHVSRSLPDSLWLTQMRQDGDAVTIEGRSTTLFALSDFVGNLGTSALLQKPVEIVNSQVDVAPSNASGAGRPEQDLVRFVVKAQMASAAAPAPGTPGRPAAPGAPAAPPATH